MARAYWQLKGRANKTKFIGRQKGYHGVNFGGVSVGGIPANQKHFGPILDVDHLPHTMIAENAFSRGMPEHGAELAEVLLELIEKHDADHCCRYCGADGRVSSVIPPPKGYLRDSGRSAMTTTFCLFLMRLLQVLADAAQ